MRNDEMHGEFSEWGVGDGIFDGKSVVEVGPSCQEMRPRVLPENGRRG
jgi:hypothetical protein